MVIGGLGQAKFVEVMSYVTLDVAGHACPLSLHGDSGCGVGALDVGVVIVPVVQLERDKKI